MDDPDRLRCMCCQEEIDYDEDFLETEDGVLCIVCSGEIENIDEINEAEEEMWKVSAEDGQEDI